MASLSGCLVCCRGGGGGGGGGGGALTSYLRSLYKEMAEYDSIKEFLRSGCYPSDCSKDQNRAFRRKASYYKLERGVLYYSKVVGRNPSLPEEKVITSTSERGR